MAYTNIDDPSAYFQTKTYTGTNNSNALTNDGNSDLKPDFIWIKRRDYDNGHQLLDSTRGVDKILGSELTSAETTLANRLSSFDTDGFTVESSSGAFNASGEPFVAWQWKAGGGTTTSVSASGTGSGCVNACTYQANTTAGFSIITYTGRDDQLNNGQESKLTHGLGVAPTFTIMKRRDANADWYVMGKNVTTSSAYSTNEYVALNSNVAINGSSYTGDTAPDSTHIFLGNELVNVADALYICYAFAEKQGFSKFGKYIGNGDANGPFVYLGFRPAFVMIRQLLVAAGDDWILYDNKREPENVAIKKLFPNQSAAESSSYDTIDMLSNGFKARTNLGGTNSSGKTYIYMAFAENPFVTSTGIPTTAR
jgi:hypothetical protein